MNEKQSLRMEGYRKFWKTLMFICVWKIAQNHTNFLLQEITEYFTQNM